jgi:hypothetical protein
VDVCRPSSRGIPAPCAGIVSANPTSTYPISLDPYSEGTLDVAGAGGGSGEYTMWNGILGTISAYSTAGSPSATSTRSVTITFTATSSNAMLAWGGHIASGAYWVDGGQPDGAGAITKGSWEARAGLGANGSVVVRNTMKVGILPSALQ